jgi:hypothetical protein
MSVPTQNDYEKLRDAILQAIEAADEDGEDAIAGSLRELLLRLPPVNGHPRTD